MKQVDKTCLEIFQQRHTIDILLAIKEVESIGFNQLQEKLDVNTLTLQRRLEDLQGKKFVEKKENLEDSRSYDYLLSQRGKTASAKLIAFKEFLIETTP